MSKHVYPLSSESGNQELWAICHFTCLWISLLLPLFDLIYIWSYLIFCFFIHTYCNCIWLYLYVVVFLLCYISIWLYLVLSIFGCISIWFYLYLVVFLFWFYLYLVAFLFCGMYMCMYVYVIVFIFGFIYACLYSYLVVFTFQRPPKWPSARTQQGAISMPSPTKLV